MTLLQSRFTAKNAQHFDAASTSDLALLLDANGGLESTATGLRLKSGTGRLTRGALNPATANIAIPTAAGAETTVRNGDALEAFDQYLITSDGQVAGLDVHAGDYLVATGGTLPPAAIGDFIVVHGEAAAAAAAAFTTQVFTVDAGTKASGAFTLSGTPVQPTQTILNVAGAGAQAYTVDYSVAGTTLTVAAALLAVIEVGDVLTVEWK